MRSPFVGRAAELGVLEEHGTRAAAGEGSVVLIAGPAGIGKTALVNESVARLDGSWRVARGFCAHDTGAPPLWPWQRGLRLAGVQAEPSSSPASDPAHLASARFAQLNRASEGLAACAAEQPLLILLEDLHWADTASLELLKHVAQGVAETRLMVLGTFREPAEGDVATALAGLARYGARTLRLSPFTTVEVAQYLGSGAEAAAVALRTGGLPLLVAASAPGTGPADLAAVVDGLLAAIPEEQQATLVTAALLGNEVDLHLLARVGGRPSEESNAALVSGTRAGLLSTVDGGLRFTHALLQEALAGKADSRTVAEVHRQAAEALADTAPAAQVAAHWRRAGKDPAALRATAEWSRAAARQAQRVYATEDAIDQLRSAQRALSAVDPGSADLAELLVELATAEYLAGRYQDSLRHCADAAELGRTLGRPDLIAHAALVLRNVSFVEAGQVVVSLCRLALSYPDLTPTLRARLLAQLAAFQADFGQHEEAREATTEALRLAEGTGDPLTQLDAIRAREMTLIHPDELTERLRLGERAIQLAEAVGDPLAVTVGHLWRLRAGYQLARLDIVDTAIGGIAAVAAGQGLPLLRWHLLRANASRAVLEGDFARARSANLEALQLALGSGDSTAVGMSYVMGQHLAETRGDPGELLPGTLEMLLSAPQMPLISCSHAVVHLIHGRLDEARPYYEEVAPLAGAPAPDIRWGGVLVHLARLAQVFEDVPTAELLYDQIRPWAQHPGAWGTPTAYFHGSVSQLMGQLAALTGRLDEAETWLRQAVTQNVALRARPSVVTSKLDLARVLIKLNRPELSLPLISEATAEAKRLGMPGTLADLTRLRVAADSSDPLSPREREVADLVRKAWTNRQIAEQLVLSERTVESHVRSILTKLSCANRAELIARASASR